MPGISPFTLQVSDLKNLGQDRAVESTRRLLWAEAARVGVGKNLIDVPDCINVGDGGIDAYIENATPTQDEVIPAGTSGFQIKSSGLQPNACKKELHVGNDLNQPLKPEIKRILDAGGTYILVLFADITSPQATAPREQAVKDDLTRLGYQNPKVRLYTANKLSGFIERFPALVAWFKNDRSYCLSYSVWAENRDIQIPKSFVFDEVRRRFADEITDKLRNSNGQCVVFRVTGLSGIGKTRFVYEALGRDDIKQRVIYVKADPFRLSPLYQTLQTDQNLSGIIVVDECDLQHHEELVRSFSSRGDRLALLTLSYEIGSVPQPSLAYKITSLTEESIKKLLKAEAAGLPENVVDRLSKFADGYPRIATLLAESYRTSGGTTQAEFIDISDDGLMERLIGGDPNTDHFRKTKKVLQGLSLFTKVGFEGELAKESEWVSGTVGVDFNDFQDIVGEQRARGIIQGQNYIYVTPFMLRVYLLRGWWESHGFTNESFKQFVESIPEAFRTDLLRRFFDQLPYIATSERGKEFAKVILGNEGLFSDGFLLKTQFGGDFFLSLTEADPESALLCLQSTIGTWSKDELLAFKEGRREAVWALEKIAVWKELFAGAARLLLALAEAENERYANNASGIFTDLFSLGPGEVAPTEASPTDRFPVLEEALNSTSKERRMLGLKACSKALESNYFHRMVGPEYQGLRRVAQLWRPKNRQEVIDDHRYVWQLLYGKLEDFGEDERQEVIKVLLGHIRGLSYIPELVDMIISDTTKLAAKPYGNKKQIIHEIESILHYGRKDLLGPTMQRWEKLRDSLVGGDFHSLLERYVSMDLLEDKYDEDGKRTGKVDALIKNLVEQTIKNPKLLEKELSWLPTNEAKNGYQFGYELGREDKKSTFLPMFLEAQRKVVDSEDSSDYFLGGYLKALFERDPKGWEDLLDNLARDKKLATWVPGLTWRSGLSDRSALRILDLAKKGIIAPYHFRVFGLGSVISDLSEKVFIQWIDFLLSSAEDYAVSIALDLYQFFYLRKESKHKLPDKLTLRLLTHPSLFRKPSKSRRDQMDDFHWKEIGNKFIELYPKNCLPLAEIIFENFGEDGGILEDYHSDTQQVIDNVARKYPEEVWDIVAKHLGPPIDSRAFHIKEWLRGSEFSSAGESGALPFFPTKKVWEWVDKNVEKRAWYVASFAPKLLFRQKDKPCWAREILVKYGDRKDVRQTMDANFYTEGFSGPASLHYKQKKEQLLAFREGESNANVKRWIDEEVSLLDKYIAHEIIQEERRGF